MWIKGNSNVWPPGSCDLLLCNSKMAEFTETAPFFAACFMVEIKTAVKVVGRTLGRAHRTCCLLCLVSWAFLFPSCFRWTQNSGLRSRILLRGWRTSSGVWKLKKVKGRGFISRQRWIKRASLKVCNENTPFCLFSFNRCCSSNNSASETLGSSHLDYTW